MNVPCANCDSECSSQALTCRRCGHPLRSMRFNEVFAVTWRAVLAVAIVVAMTAATAYLAFLVVLLLGAIVRRV